MLGTAGKDQLISNVLVRMNTPALTDQQKPYVHRFCADTVCCLEDLPIAMADKKKNKRIRDVGSSR